MHHGTEQVNKSCHGEKALIMRSEGNPFPNDERNESKRPAVTTGSRMPIPSPGGGRSESVYQRVK
jgi:hypothetical protein